MKRKNFVLTLIVCTIFIVSFLMMILSSALDSETTDEGIHLFSGYTYLVKKDFRLDPEHPPLLKVLGALPLVFFRDLKVNLDSRWEKAGNFYYDSWQEARTLAEDFFYTYGNNPEKLLFWGRLPFILLTLLLGYVGFLWARKLYGSKAGVLAAFLILFFPNILAHGRLVNTDLGVILFIFLTIYFWGAFLKRPNFLNCFLSGFFLGLTLASKFTGLIIVPILIVLALTKVVFFDERKRVFLKYLVGFLGILAISLIVVWATYGFLFKVPPPVPSGFVNAPLWGNRQLTPALSDFINRIRPILFPADFYKGLFMVFRHAALGHGSFLLGQTSSSGWWYYFPVAIFYKTPLPIFIFLGLAIIFFKKLRAQNFFDEILLIVPPIVFLILSMFSKADLGLRHILPIFPFLFVFASKSINLVNFNDQESLRAKAKQSIISSSKIATPRHIVGARNDIFIGLFVLLIIWYLFSTLSSFPNFLAYFNEFAGGSKNGYKILADSNLDWGQDIYRLKKYLEQNKQVCYWRNNIGKIYIVYPWNGDAALKYYNINFEPLYPENRDIKGPVVISATYLQTEAYSWLRKYSFSQITPGLFILQI